MKFLRAFALVTVMDADIKSICCKLLSFIVALLLTYHSAYNVALMATDPLMSVTEQVWGVNTSFVATYPHRSCIGLWSCSQTMCEMYDEKDVDIICLYPYNQNVTCHGGGRVFNNGIFRAATGLFVTSILLSALLCGCLIVLHRNYSGGLDGWIQRHRVNAPNVQPRSWYVLAAFRWLVDLLVLVAIITCANIKPKNEELKKTFSDTPPGGDWINGLAFAASCFLPIFDYFPSFITLAGKWQQLP